MALTQEQIKGQIRNIAKDNKAEARALIRIYMMERFLERAANFPYAENFVIIHHLNAFIICTFLSSWHYVP